MRSWPVVPTPAVLGTQVYAVPCNASDTTTLGWAYDPDSKMIRGPGVNQCLAVANGTQLRLSPCASSGDRTSQQFTIGANKTLVPATLPDEPDTYRDVRMAEIAMQLSEEAEAALSGTAAAVT